MECALKGEGEKLLIHRMGNVISRSPEGQLGTAMGNLRSGSLLHS